MSSKKYFSVTVFFMETIPELGKFLTQLSDFSFSIF